MTTTKQNILSRIAVAFLIAGMIFTFVPAPAYAILYSPGETLNPACAPTDVNCGVAPSLTTNNTNSVNFGPMATTTGGTAELRFLELAANGSNYTGLKAPDALAANVLFILPSADGTSGQILSTNGSGALAWATNTPSQWTTSGSNIYYNIGNVGIGTITPSGTLHVANASSTNALVVSTNGNVGLGIASPSAKLEVSGAVLANGFNATSTSSPYQINGATVLNIGNGTTFVGSGAGVNNQPLALGSTFIGFTAGQNNTTGFFNTAVGNSALFANTVGSNNTANGDNSLVYNTTGGNNSAFGSSALRGNTVGSNNTAVGSYAIWSNTGSSNTAVGSSAGNLLATGSNNILYGFRAGGNITTGSNNLIIGYDIDVPSATGSNQLSIGNLIFGTGLNATGTAIAAGNIGIGASAPVAKLTVSATGTTSPLSVGGETNVSVFPGWPYRSPITVNASSALTNYQTSITVDTAALVTAGKMQSDGRDIRITASDGTTLVDYWIETGTMNTASTKIWFEASSLTNGSNIFYLYYGNASAAAASNGDNTFIFFDDFNGSSVDAAKWTVDNSTGLSVSGGNLIAANNDAKLRSQWSYAGTPVIQETQAIITADFAVPHNVTYGGFWTSGSDGISFLRFRSAFMPLSEDGYFIPENIVPSGNTNSIPLNTEFLSRASVISGTQVAAQMINYSTNALINNQTRTNTVSNGERILLVRSPNDAATNATGSMSIRFVRVRQYAATEPVVSVGSEGAIPIAPTPTTFLTVNSSGNVLPGANNAYDLGSATNKWKDLYLSGTTLYLGNQTLSNQSGSLTWSGTSIAAAPSATSTSELKLSELSTNGANYTGFKAPDSLAGNVLYTLPNADGASGQMLSSNGTGALSWITPAGGGITSLNGLATSTQMFVAGNTGTDFVITSSGSAHTFNLPNASATARGLVSTSTQTFAGDKTFSGALTVNGTTTAGAILGNTFHLQGASPVIGLNTGGTRLRLTAGQTDTADNNQGANVDLQSIAAGGALDLVAGRGGAITFWTSTSTQTAQQRGAFDQNGLLTLNNGLTVSGATTSLASLAVVGGNVSIMSSPPFSVTGGTITTSGLYTIHTFTSSGTFTSNGAVNVEYLVVAGGGGGGGADGGGGGGGGAGGLLASSTILSAGSYTVSAGLGGTAGTAGGFGTLGGNGGNSSFDSITAVGGGGGGRGISTASNGLSGGSGGGSGAVGAGGNGTVGQGNNGGNGSGSYGGGGGGAGAVGGSNGVGGAGTASSISGTSVTYAGGGGAGTGSSSAGQPGGSGGGGTGGGSGGAATAGTNGLGAGGGGARWGQNGAAGGSGVVIARYLTPSSTGGNVGIGTTTPNNALAVNGGITLASTTPATTANALYNQAGALYWNGSTVGGSSQWTTSGSNIYYNTGNVAIGTSTPSATARLLISGAVSVITNPNLVSGNGAVNTTTVPGQTIITYTTTGSSTFTPPTGVTSVEYLVVAGGGGGGSAIAGGGGAGGYLTGTTTVAAQSYSITVGGGGAGGVGNAVNGNSGSDSIFSTITATGGGGAGAGGNAGSTGGSGGGARAASVALGATGQGNNSGNNSLGINGGSGGGGAGAVGGNTASGTSGAGGNGLSSSISGTAITYAGGGGGGGYLQGLVTGATGGTGGGGAGGQNVAGTAGTANRGGGGGGGGYDNSGPINYSGGNGGSGIVIVRFATQTTAPANQALLRVTDTGTVASTTLAFFEGTSGQGCIIAGQTTSLACSSDISLKKNVNGLESSLGNVLALKPVIFDWNSEADGAGNHIGFIAQDVEQIFPGLVVTDPNGKKALSYDRFAPILTKAIQELSEKVDALMGVVVDTLKATEGYFKRIFANELCLTDSSGALVCVTGEDLKQLLGPETSSSQEQVVDDVVINDQIDSAEAQETVAAGEESEPAVAEEDTVVESVPQEPTSVIEPDTAGQSE